MIKNECDIVKDLLPSYIEENLSDSSKEFVDTHIKSCDNCKEVLEVLKNEKVKEKEKKQAEDMAEIDYLKKYNRKINILKIVASSLTVFIVIEWGIFGGKFAYNKIEENFNEIKAEREYNEKYEKGKYVKSILDPVYDRACEILEGKNFKFSYEAKIDDKVIKNYKYLRKDDITKIVNADEVLGTPITTYFYPNVSQYSGVATNISEDYYREEEYGIDYSGILRHTVYKNLQTGEYYAGDGFKGENKFSGFDSINNFLEFYYVFNNFDEIEFAKLTVKEDTYDGKECYVLTSSTYEIWIDKASNLIIFKKEYYNYGDYKDSCIEYKYTWDIGNTEAKDVMLPEYTGTRRRL